MEQLPVCVRMTGGTGLYEFLLVSKDSFCVSKDSLSIEGWILAQEAGSFRCFNFSASHPTCQKASVTMFWSVSTFPFTLFRHCLSILYNFKDGFVSVPPLCFNRVSCCRYCKSKRRLRCQRHLALSRS